MGWPAGRHRDTVRVDFVPARPVEPKPAEAGQSFDEQIACTAARALGLKPGTVDHMLPGDRLRGSNRQDTLASYLASCDAVIELNRTIIAFVESALPMLHNFRHPRDPVRRFVG